MQGEVQPFLEVQVAQEDLVVPYILDNPLVQLDPLALEALDRQEGQELLLGQLDLA